MTDDEIIDAIIVREGGLSNDPLDRGGLTYKGLSQRANPDLFVNGLPTDKQVHDRYMQRYVVWPGFDNIADTKVRSLLVDWGVNSGPGIAIMGLQRVCRTTPDGKLGPKTLAAAALLPVETLIKGLVAERVMMISRIVVRNPSQIKFLNGWLNRALEWLF